MAADGKKDLEEISYDIYLTCRHYSQDVRIAKMIERAFRRFRIPVEFRADYQDSRFRHIYFDKEKHPGLGGLPESTINALNRARYLVVVCTPRTKDSPRVNREIEYFLEHHDRSQLLTVLAKGETNTSFPEPLLREYERNGITFMREEEQQADADLTGGGERLQKRRLNREMIRLFARILKCPFETLWNLDRRFRMRKTIAYLAGIIFLCVGIGGSLFYRNRQLRDTGIETTDKYEETRRLAADTMVEKGNFLLLSGDWKGATKAALEAMPYTDERTAVRARAEGLLTSALGAYRAQGILRESYSLNLKQGMDYCVFSADGERIYCVDALYDVRCFRVSDGKVIFTSTHRTPVREPGQGEIAPENRLILLEEDQLILCNSPGSVRAISTESGQPVWEYFFDWENDFRIMNHARDGMVVIDREEAETPEGAEKEYVTKVMLLDTRTGTVRYEAPFRIPSSFLFDYVKNYGGHNGVFSREDDRFIGAIYVDERRQHDENNRAAGLLYFTWTMSEEASQDDIRYFHAEGVWEDFTNPVFGMVLDDAENSVTVTRYDTSSESVRTQQIRFDGLRRDPSFVPQRLRGTAPEEETAYLAGSDMIIVSMNDTIHLYRKANSAYCMSKREDADILNLRWFDEDETILVAMLNNGSAVIYELDADTDDGTFIKNRTIVDVTQDMRVRGVYASALPVRLDGKRYRLNHDMAMAVVPFDDPAKTGMFLPYIDPHAADLTPALTGAEKIRLCVMPGEELLYCFVAEAGRAGSTVYTINPVTLAAEPKGHALVYPAAERALSFARDKNHFLYEGYLYDFDDRSNAYDGHEEALLAASEAGTYRISLTKTGTLYLYGADSDRMIYHGENETLRPGRELFVNADEDNDRLFISDGACTTCLDLNVFEQIFTVEGTVLYAPAGNRIFVNLTDEDGEGFRLVAFPTYSTEELIAWGEEALAEE